MDSGGGAVFLHREHGMGTDGNEPFLGAFSEDADRFVGGIDVFNVEGCQFGEAEAGGVEKLEDGGVPFAHPGRGLSREFGFHGKFEEFLDLGKGQDDREGFVGFREFHFGNRAFGVAATVDEEFVKGAVGRKAEADGAARQFFFLKGEKVGAEVVGGEVAPAREFFAVPFAEEAEGESVVLEGFGRGVFLGGEKIDEGFNFLIGGCFHEVEFITKSGQSGKSNC